MSLFPGPVDPDSPFEHEELIPERLESDAPDCWTTHLGSWGQTVKKYGIDGSEIGRAWNEDDISSTVDALVATGQNFYIYPIDTDDEWEQFIDLLDRVDGTNIKVYAGMQSHTTYYENNRWFNFGAGGPPPECNITHDYTEWECDRAFINNWLNAWMLAAETCSAISRFNKNLVGFVIDDFDMPGSIDYPVCLDGIRMTRDEIKQIADACHSHNPSFGFYPSFGASNFGRFVGSGYVLGANYGVRISAGESMSVKLQFNLKRGGSALIPAYLRFFHFSVNADSTPTKSVWIDGSEIWTQALNGSTRQQYTTITLSSIKAGTHEIEFKLYSTSNAGLGVNFWRIWGITLLEFDIVFRGIAVEIGFHPVIISATTFETIANSGAYPALEGGMGFIKSDMINNSDSRGWSCSAELQESSTDGYSLRRLVAAPNTDYLIHDIVDGIFPYTSTTVVNGPDDALDADSGYPVLLATLKEEFGDKLVIPMHWALPVGEYEVSPDVLARRVELSAEYADGAAVWNYPLGIEFMNEPDRRGIFAESAVLEDSKGAPYGGYHYMAQWPGRQSSLRGWYQQWVYTGGLGASDLWVTVEDSRNQSSDHEGSMYKVVESGGFTVWERDIHADGTAPDDVPETVLQGQGLAYSTTRPVILKMERRADGAGVGSRVFFLLTSRGISNPQNYFKFESGVDSDAVSAFEMVKSVFLGIRDSECA